MYMGNRRNTLKGIAMGNEKIKLIFKVAKYKYILLINHKSY